MNNKTIEEAANDYANKKGDIPTTELENAIFKQGFIDGAKWQAERMYSEEEVLTLLNAFSNRNGIVEDEQLTKKWFEQFKKK